MPGHWIVERVEEDRFPYRIRIEDAGGETLCLRAQDRWPAAGRSLFCLREKEPPAYAEEIERVPVTSITRFGRRLTVILGRKQKKRCDFLFLTEEYRDRPGETYEQIFWHTQAFLHKHRAKIKLSLNAKLQGLTIAVDTRERYPWSFSGKAVRRQLPVGDYALLEGERLRAVPETGRGTGPPVLRRRGRLQPGTRGQTDPRRRGDSRVACILDLTWIAEVEACGAQSNSPPVPKGGGELKKSGASSKSGF